MPVPPALAKAFEDRATVSSVELCRLLPIDREALRSCCRAGQISFVRFGSGKRSPRRFTLAAVLEFLEARTERLEPPTITLRRKPTPSLLSPEASATMARRDARLAEMRRRRLVA